MKLEISEATSLVLALPAHRSGNEGHRKMGEKAFDLVMEYKTLGTDETEQAFNRAMICTILSTVRAFSVERDRIGGVWASINAVKKRREGYLEAIRSLGPLGKENYWSKAIALIAAAGLTFKLPLSTMGFSYSVWILLAIIVFLQLLSIFLEVIVSAALEKKLPIEKEEKWKTESMVKYRQLLGKFLDEAISHHKRYYPKETKLYGFDTETEEGWKLCKEHLLRMHVYF